MTEIRVLLADDHPATRLGVATIIGTAPDMTLIGQATSGREAIALFEDNDPDVIVMDLRMADISGYEATARIRRIAPDARILVLTSYDLEDDIQQALGAGAMGYLLKDAAAEELLSAIRAVHAGQRWMAAAVAKRLDESVPMPGLSPRELQILDGLRKGLTNHDIAAMLGLRENTVKFYLKRLFAKLQVADRTEAVVVAIERGILRVA